MVSNIDPTKPAPPIAYTVDMRNNFAAAKTEIETLQSRASNVANLLDYQAGTNGDDALAMRNAIASGKKFIFVPPGIYTNKSVIYTGTAHAAGPTCWLFDGLTDTYIFAYGATFLIDNDSAFGPGVDKGSSFLQISNNCKNVGMFGGTMVGNKKSLTFNRENCAFLIAGVTGLTLRDVKVTGEFLTFFAGVFAFDSLIENCHGYNLASAIDISSLENVTFSKCFFSANPDNPVNGVTCHYDTFTLLDGANITYEQTPAEVTAGTSRHRDLRFMNTNGLKFNECVFDGYYNGILIDSCRGALINKCVIRGATRSSGTFNSSGITLLQGANAITAGYITSDVVIEDCEISGHAVVSGGAGQGYGINIVPGVSGGIISQVLIVNNRIYDNDHIGIGSSNYNPGSASNITVQTCDFASRTGSVVQTVNVITQILGLGPPLGPYSPITAPTFFSGIHFGSVFGASNTDVTQHLDLYAGTIGLGVSASRLNYICGASSVHAFMVGATQMLTINSTGLNNTAIGVTTANTGKFSTLAVVGNIGFFNTAPIAKPTAGGAWAGNAAGKALSTALAALGLITDTSTA